MTRITAKETDEEVDRLLNFLAGMPKGNAATTRSVVTALMLKTGGSMTAQGCLYDIRSRPLGGGVYRLSLVRSAE